MKTVKKAVWWVSYFLPGIALFGIAWFILSCVILHGHFVGHSWTTFVMFPVRWTAGATLVYVSAFLIIGQRAAPFLPEVTIGMAKAPFYLVGVLLLASSVLPYLPPVRRRPKQRISGYFDSAFS